MPGNVTDATDATTEISNRLRNREFPEESLWFFELLCDSNTHFGNRETVVWDYKRDWPFSYSDRYFRSLVKHIIGFANTSGGILIFGVDDESRKTISSKIKINMDRLRVAIQNIVENPPEIDLRNYSTKLMGEVNVLIVYPNELVCLAASFKSDYADSNDLFRFWIRSGHETVQAQAKHIPLLFCGSARGVTENPALESELPPNPARIRQFVGRLDTMAEIFAWLRQSLEPRAFLYGRGGSGKSTIAYELAKNLASYGKNIEMDNGQRFDSVIYLSAKEIELSTESGKIQQYKGTDFSDALTLFQSIIILANISDCPEPYKLSMEETKLELQVIFDTMSLLIIVDDIDTLTTKGIDPGSDTLFRLLIRGSRTCKILYTQRNVTSHAVTNSIEVPGLRPGREYRRFVEVCCKQFSLDKPNVELRDGRLEEITERRPLVVESIIALRRNTGSYEQAISLFEENVGLDARKYVFQREWDALPANNNARHLLCALAHYGQRGSFGDLVAILQNSPEVVSEAVSDCREMFLDVQDISDESYFILGSLTRSFVLKLSEDLDRLVMVKARVDSFQKTHLPDYPELGRLIERNSSAFSRAKNSNDAERMLEIWRSLNSTTLAPKITEDPRFRAFRGYVAVSLLKPDMDQARTDFRFAISMKHEPELWHLSTWHWVEENSGHGGKVCNEIVEFVVSARNYSGEEKTDFIAKKASRLYRRGLQERNVNFVESVKFLTESVLLHTKNVAVAELGGYVKIHKWENHLRNTWLILFQTCVRYGEIDSVIDAMVEATNLKPHLMDFCSDAIDEYLSAIAINFRGKKSRLKGRMNHLHERLSKANWESESVKNSVTSQVSRIKNSVA